MKKQEEYINDLTEIRSMMERSSKFLSLSGWSGVVIGIYALAAAFFANLLMQQRSDYSLYEMSGIPGPSETLLELIGMGVVLLFLAVGTAIFLSHRKSRKINEPLWNATARRLVINMCIPLFTGGILIFILISKGFPGLILPLTLLFYGLTLVNAGKYSYAELRYLGAINIALGLVAVNFIDYALLFWATGFGILHIIYGLYIYMKYEK
ncbi:hypothetical protein [Flavobacterium pallidum]|uniref:Uncharacterized protein n=1 Tax=Flavobacterium pallidum TaxID=2172098 RepID=A0A2S1SIM9_9FLAO|nr:hypothetical protein [Flavobacterium pallidum]AWI26266.1 hypothetical protein HYN49_10335 [Flavobacterium pallidum]